MKLARLRSLGNVHGAERERERVRQKEKLARHTNITIPPHLLILVSCIQKFIQIFHLHVLTGTMCVC